MGMLVHEWQGTFRRMLTLPNADLGGLIKRAVPLGALCYWWSNTTPLFDAVDFSQGFAATADPATNLANCMTCNATVDQNAVLSFI